MVPKAPSSLSVRAPANTTVQQIVREIGATFELICNRWTLPLYGFAESPYEVKGRIVIVMIGSGARALAMAVLRHPIYVSYKRDEYVSLLRKLVDFLDKNFIVITDERQIGYKDSIGNFVDELSKGGCIVAIIGRGYLRSSWCMREMLGMYKQKQFSDRIFPLYLPDADIFSLEDRARLAKYWEDRYARLKKDLAPNLDKFPKSEQEEFLRIRDFASQVHKVIAELADRKSYKLAQLIDSDWESLRDALIDRLATLDGMPMIEIRKRITEERITKEIKCNIDNISNN